MILYTRWYIYIHNQRDLHSRILSINVDKYKVDETFQAAFDSFAIVAHYTMNVVMNALVSGKSMSKG